VIAGFISSHFILALMMGACLYIAMQHLWFWQRGRHQGSHLWVAGFCVSALLFELGRCIEVQSTEPAPAILSARLEVAMVPFFIYCLVGFARSLKRRSTDPRFALLCFAITAAVSTAALCTDWFISNQTFPETDWLGHQHISPDGTQWMLALAAGAIPGFGYLAHQVWTAQELHASERRALLGSMGLFTAMGISSIFSSINWVSFPIVSQYGPFVLAVGLSYLLVHQHSRMQNQLEAMVEERTQQLAESEANHRQLFENAPLGILSCDRSGRLLAINPNLMLMLGSRPDAAPVGVELFEVPELVESGIAAALRCCIETGKPSRQEFRFASAWHASNELRVHCAPLREADDAVIGAQALCEDIREQKRLEERLRQSQRMEAVGGLAAGIAHEINNPMAYVRANLSMLREEWEAVRSRVEKSCDNDDERERLSECEELIDESLDGVERTIRIVRDVREFSHTSSHGWETAAVNDLLEDSLRVAALQLSPSMVVERDLGQLPPLHCSPNQLRQVFLNLAVNAIHALDGEGTLRVKTRAIEGAISVEIADDGCGIDEEVLERLFDPFFTTKQANEGTGLGLYISYEIVRMHGGSIQVQSRSGQGASFEVHLPLATPDRETSVPS
jgi:PAS domain S-box-containing protein